MLGDFWARVIYDGGHSQDKTATRICVFKSVRFGEMRCVDSDSSQTHEKTFFMLRKSTLRAQPRCLRSGWVMFDFILVGLGVATAIYEMCSERRLSEGEGWCVCVAGIFGGSLLVCINEIVNSSSLYEICLRAHSYRSKTGSFMND